MLAVALIAQRVVSTRREPAGLAVVSVSGEMVGKLQLDRDGTFKHTGAEGRFEVSCDDGEVRMVSSTCADGLCVKQGAIRMAGQTIVCLPNRVSIRLDGAANGGMDAVTR